MSGIDACVAEWTRMALQPGFFYCNELPWRCSREDCADCSTFAARGIDHGYPDSIDLCSNSFTQAAWCANAERTAQFTARFGPGVGTFISYDQAQHVVCLGFRGSDLGRRPDWSGDGHVECILGQGKRTVGAHSHATGVGFDNNGLDNHQLSYFAVPPPFLPELLGPPVDAATLAAIKKLIEWTQRVSERPLRLGDTNGDVTILNDLLISKKLLAKRDKGNTYKLATRRAVHRMKVDAHFADSNGRVFGGPAALALLHP